MEDDLSHLLHLSDNMLLVDERPGQGIGGGDQLEARHEVLRGGGEAVEPPDESKLGS